MTVLVLPFLELMKTILAKFSHLQNCPLNTRNTLLRYTVYSLLLKYFGFTKKKKKSVLALGLVENTDSKQLNT